ncbi:MAG: DUF1887 family protein [Alcaligenaceae bacterium]|nr:DUF1887 family protein [Alcaligenaceae bacterium]
MRNLHLCVVTGQSLANLIPLLQERPDAIVLLCTEDKEADAQAFIQTLEAAGFSPEQVYLQPPFPAHPFEDTLEYMLNLRERLSEDFPDARLTWNATGGTKQMALAIWDALDRKKNDRAIYCDTRDGRLEELIPQAGSIALNSLLHPELYLHALGKIKRSADSDRLEWREQALLRRSATLHLGDHAEVLAVLIQQFNRQVDGNTADAQTLTLNRVGPQWRKALELLEKGRVLDPLGEEQYAIVCADGARYLTGGWLEEYIWHVAQTEQIDHVEIGLKFGDIAHRKKGQDNEIDAFIVHCNRLLLIECKSGRMGLDAVKDSDIIYKLDSIGSHAGGAQAARLLVSAQPLLHETRQGHKVDTRARASATDIHTLEAEGLKTLRTAIRDWKESGRWSEKKS